MAHQSRPDRSAASPSLRVPREAAHPTPSLDGDAVGGGAAPESPSTRLLNVADLAQIFSVGEAAIRKRIRLRQLGPVIKRGKRYVMRLAALQRFLESAEEEWTREGRETKRFGRSTLS